MLAAVVKQLAGSLTVVGVAVADLSCVPTRGRRAETLGDGDTVVGPSKVSNM